jgi:ribosomal protein S18 acetylase RimI-like enzyme
LVGARTIKVNARAGVTSIFWAPVLRRGRLRDAVPRTQRDLCSESLTHAVGLRAVHNSMTFRDGTLDDCPRLAEWDHQLIRDEGHRNPMTVPELERRMRDWLAGDWRGVIFEDGSEAVAYALFREQPDEIYLRQLFVVRYRRGEGIGGRAVGLLRTEVWPRERRLTVDVLVANERAVAFWRKVGYADYALSLEIRPDI